MKATASTVYALNKTTMNYITVDVVHNCFVSKVDGVWCLCFNAFNGDAMIDETILSKKCMYVHNINSQAITFKVVRTPKFFAISGFRQALADHIGSTALPVQICAINVPYRL